MTTLTAGSTANFSLSGRQVLTLTADNNTTGTIKRTQYVESSSSKTDTLGPPATNRTYGPFGHETDIELTCTYGSFEYDVTGTSLVTAGTDPVTGGSVFLADGWNYGAVGIVPALPTAASIIAARDKVASMGGGTVQLQAVEYAIDQEIALVSGVHFCGVVPQVTFGATDKVPDWWVAPTTGTRFAISAGVTAFTWNATDKGSSEGYLMNFALKQAKIYGIAFVGGLRAVKIGAKYAMGCEFGEIDELYCYNQTGEYAIDIQNSQFFKQGRIRCMNNLAAGGGGYRYAASVASADLLPGDSHIEELYVRSVSRKSKGVVFEAYGATAATLNDVKVTGRIHSSRYGATTPEAANLVTTSGNVDISVPDNTEFDRLQLGMPIQFNTTAPTGFTLKITYFVIARGANTVRLAETDNTATGITPTSSNTYAAYVGGYPTLIVRGDSGCVVKNSSFGNIACEVTGNTGAVYFSNTRNCDANLNNPTTSFVGAGVILRNAEIGITYSGASNVTVDNSGEQNGWSSFTNLAGGAYPYSGGSFSLDSSWNGRKVRYTGTSDITITVPAGLPDGFEAAFVTTGATGIITFAPASSLSVWSKGGGLRTNGQYASVVLRNIARMRYHLSGDTQV